MILIFSHIYDSTTDKVIKWLKHFGYNNILRLNNPDRFFVNEVKLSKKGELQIILKFLNKKISLDDIKFVWYRNNPIELEIININYLNCNNNLKAFYKSEWNKLREFILSELFSKPSLGNYFDNNLNKIKNLQIAAHCGFRIPKTTISESAEVLNKFSNENPTITKPINDIFEIRFGRFYIDMHTTEIPTKLNLSEKPDIPCLLQEKIEKWIELRVFVLYNRIYSMAIFSQLEESSKIDSRDSINIQKRRIAPYNLPKDKKEQIHQFMKKCNYNTGSIDLILTKNQEYVFLEINPIGVIEMLEPCNFNIEKDIALEIIKRHDN